MLKACVILDNFAHEDSWFFTEVWVTSSKCCAAKDRLERGRDTCYSPTASSSLLNRIKHRIFECGIPRNDLDGRIRDLKLRCCQT